VDLKRIYAVATAAPDLTVSRLDKEAITPWIGTLVFPIMSHGTIHLYVPSAVSHLAWAHPSSKVLDKRSSTILVPWIPVGVQAQVTNLQSFINTQDAEGEMRRDLRWDLLQMVHSFSSPHLSKLKTLSALKDIVWWNGIEKDVSYFVDTCET